MEFYLFVVILLIILAASDLIVDTAAFVRLYHGINNDLSIDDPWILINCTQGL